MAAKVGVKPEEYAAHMPGHLLPVAGRGQEALQEGRRPRLALRVDQDRRRVQRRQQGLQGSPERRGLHLPGLRHAAVRPSPCPPVRWLAHPQAAARPAPGRRWWLASFLLPLLLWSALSYMPFLWHPFVEITDPGGLPDYPPGTLVEREALAEENAAGPGRGQAAGRGRRRPTPSTCPPRTRWREALYTAFLHAAAAAQRALAAPEPVAQPAGHLLGLPAVVAGRRAARDPVRHLPVLRPGCTSRSSSSSATCRRRRSARWRWRCWASTTPPRWPSSSSARSSSRCWWSPTPPAGSTAA